MNLLQALGIKAKQIEPKGNIETRQGKHWIIMPDLDDLGPYDKKADAEDDLRGLRRFEKSFANCKGGEHCKCHGRTKLA